MGIWLGYATRPKLSLFYDAANYLEWDGSMLLIKAGNFELDAEGKIIAKGTVSSSDYVSGLAGWQIDDKGDAEFNNVWVRGVIHSSVFQYNEIQATAGTLGVYKNAGRTAASFTTPATQGSVSIIILADSDNVARFAVDDYVYIRTWNGIKRHKPVGDRHPSQPNQ